MFVENRYVYVLFRLAFKSKAFLVSFILWSYQMCNEWDEFFVPFCQR